MIKMDKKEKPMYSVLVRKGDTIICEASNISMIRAYNYVTASLTRLHNEGIIVNDYSFESMPEHEFGVYADIVLKSGDVCTYYIVAQMGNEKYIPEEDQMFQITSLTENENHSSMCEPFVQDSINDKNINK